MACSVDKGVDDFKICSDHLHYNGRKIPRLSLNTIYMIGHGEVEYIEHVAEVVDRNPHMLFAFIADKIGGKICCRHKYCLYLPRCLPFPTNEAIESALLAFLDRYVFCSSCKYRGNMDLTFDWKSDYLKGICRNKFCNTILALPPCVSEFAPLDSEIDALRNQIPTADGQEGESDLQTHGEAQSGQPREEKHGGESTTIREHL